MTLKKVFFESLGILDESLHILKYFSVSTSNKLPVKNQQNSKTLFHHSFTSKKYYIFICMILKNITAKKQLNSSQTATVLSYHITYAFLVEESSRKKSFFFFKSEKR